jgi:tetratricopeptide (TPR) repeat protein
MSVADSEEPAGSRWFHAATKFNEGVEAQGRGDNDGALASWNELLALVPVDDPDGEFVDVTARALYAKAHLLMALQRWPEAAASARAARAAAARQVGLEAQREAAHGFGIERDSVTQLGELDAAIDLDEQIAERYEQSDDFEVRECAQRALWHAISLCVDRGRQEPAIAYAKRLVASLWRHFDREHLAEEAEAVLSGAEALNSFRSRFRRAPEPVQEQVRAMCEGVIERADSIGGEIGNVVAINARIAAADALARDRHLLASAADRFARPSVKESELDALALVEKAALAAGAEGRYVVLVTERAMTLNGAGRTSEAHQVLDALRKHIDASGGPSAKGSAAHVAAMRKLILP